MGWIDEGHVDSQAREGVVKLIIGAAIEPVTADDVVARLAQGQNRYGLGGVTAAGCQRADAAFQIGDALLQDVGRGIHDTRIDVAGLLQGKQVGGVFCALELEAGGLIDRHGAAAGGWVRALPGVQLPRVEAESAFVRRHDPSFSFWYVIGCTRREDQKRPSTKSPEDPTWRFVPVVCQRGGIARLP